MKTRELDGTGRSISAIGIGAMHLSLSNRPAKEKALQVLHEAFDLGITFIDTADSYCIDESEKHHNERLIQEAIDRYEGPTGKLTVATKGGLTRPSGAWKRNGDPEHIRKTIQESHEILDGEYPITLWQFHAPDEQYSITESLTPAVEAREEQLIEHLGVSNFSLEQLREAQDLVEIVSVQNEYHPWEMEPEKSGLISYCEEHDITFLPYRPLGGRHRVGKLSEFETVRRIAERHNASPQQVVLAWHRCQSNCIIPIPGVSRVKTLRDSVHSIEVELETSEMDALNNAFPG